MSEGQVKLVLNRSLALVAGADIAQFTDFVNGEDGVAYERQIDECISLLESLPMPT
jgi:enoyl-CoA hydratase